MYVVTRRDLPVGSQACQLAHAMREFIDEYPETEYQWYKESNRICFLVVNNLDELSDLIERATELKIRCSWFHEEDLEEELTAAAFEPNIESKRLLSQLPLAMKD